VMDLFFKLADAIKRLDMSPARASTMLAGMGIDPGSIQLIIQGRKALQDYYDQAARLSGITDANSEAANRADLAWKKMALAAQGLGRTLAAELLPPLTDAANAFTTWLEGVFKEVKSKGFGTVLHENLVPFGARPAATFSDRFSAVGPGLAPMVRSGGGGDAVGIAAVKHVLEGEGFRVTSTTGGEHVGTAHGAGLAIDVKPRPGVSYAAEAARLQARMAELGVRGRVINAETRDSAAWTGPHVHAEFASAADVARFAAAGGGAARGPAGSTSSTQVNINTINVTTSEASAPGIAKDIGAAVKQHSFATQSNSGPN